MGDSAAGDLSASRELAELAGVIEGLALTAAGLQMSKEGEDGADVLKRPLAADEFDLLIGFDAAWTAANSGALVGAIRSADGKYTELGPPLAANYGEALDIIRSWQAEHSPRRTIVFLDQPTIVPNASGQRPVENLLSAAVSRRYGGMQPANTSKLEMFGPGAPVWSFLSEFGGAADPFGQPTAACVFETYPVLAIIALGWTLADPRPGGRLPKYNPRVRAKFLMTDWKHLCERVAASLQERGLVAGASWANAASEHPRPRKRDQDSLDAYLCLLVAVELAEGRDCLMVGDTVSGYIVVPDQRALMDELTARCIETRRHPEQWLRILGGVVGRGVRTESACRAYPTARPGRQVEPDGRGL